MAITDASGNIVQRYGYEAFGQLTASDPTFDNFYTYTGREYDKETGLYYYRARYYDAMEGRFISKDPIGFAGGDVNLYNYVGGNPINYVDPFGEDAVTVNFPGYPITVNMSFDLPIVGEVQYKKKHNLIHSGVLLINNKTGYTKYYEYGRYSKNDPSIVGVALADGNVRSFAVSNVVIGTDGRPTAESLSAVMEQLSRKAGKDITPITTYHEGDFDALLQAILSFANDPNRGGYGANNCISFASRAATGGL